MTNELGTTLQDIEAKAERKREAYSAADRLFIYGRKMNATEAMKNHQVIIKYIEEN